MTTDPDQNPTPGASSAAPEAEQAQRLSVILLIGAVTAFGFAITYVVLDRPTVSVLCAVLGAVLFAIRTWVARRPTSRRLELAGHFTLAAFVPMVVALQGVNPVSGHLAAWFLIVVPLAAAHLVGPMAAIGWTAATVGIEIALAVGDQWFRTRHPTLLIAFEAVGAQTGLTIAVCAFAVAARRLADERAARLEAQARFFEEARDAATAASRLKSQFLANMSHEIRTPMNGVLGMAELMQSTRLDPEQADFVRTIRSSGETLLAIINDILDFSKIEAGKMHVEEIDFDLRTTVEDVLALFAEAAHAKRLELAGQVDPSLPELVRGDPTRLRQILSNLLSNAIKFTSTGEIVLAVTAVGDRLRFSVADTGIGMSESVCARLFQPFEQADGSTTRRYGGTGLGLAISRQLVGLMGGSISVESEAGIGTTFVVDLPLRPSAQAVVDALGDEDAVRRRLAGRRVLLVDDNATNRLIQRAHLDAWGMSVVEAPDGPTALQFFGDGNFDVVLLDMQMPGMDGLELAARILGRGTRPPAMLLLTSVCDLIDPAATERVGIRAVLTKPMRQRQLRDALVGALELDAPRLDGPVPAGAPARGAATPVPRFDGLRVLLVEDNPVNLRVGLRFLEKLGCATTTAGDGAEAVELYATPGGSPDVVLMDCHMPVLDGYDATRKIRRLEAALGARRVPIIALTANTLQGDDSRCYAAGMDAFLSKPYSIAQLAEALEPYRPAEAPAIESTAAA